MQFYSYSIEQSDCSICNSCILNKGVESDIELHWDIVTMTPTPPYMVITPEKTISIGNARLRSFTHHNKSVCALLIISCYVYIPTIESFHNPLKQSRNDFSECMKLY